MNASNDSKIKQFNINGMIIKASSMNEAMNYVWLINNPIDIIVKFDEERTMKMRLQVSYQSEYQEDAIAIAMEERLELIGVSHDSYEVYMNGVWLTSSEL